eukprot:gene12409-16643_t
MSQWFFGSLIPKSSISGIVSLHLLTCTSVYTPKLVSNGVVPTIDKNAKENEQALASLSVDRELNEREERERIMRERELALALKRAEEEKLLLDKIELERKKQEEQDRLELLKRQKDNENEEKSTLADIESHFQSTLTVTTFKPLWTSLSIAGSFSCKLKIIPTMTIIVEHLKKQAFHIVYATLINNEECEIGLCNIRMMNDETWFLARFIINNLNFSAVMKAEDNEKVPKFVKKFALAKVLKIDTST